MKRCYAVVSGAYSDYSVGCIFESSPDAHQYAAMLMKISVRSYRRRAKLSWRQKDSLRDSDPRVERFQFFPRGEVPNAKVKPLWMV